VAFLLGAAATDFLGDIPAVFIFFSGPGFESVAGFVFAIVGDAGFLDFAAVAFFFVFAAALAAAAAVEDFVASRADRRVGAVPVDGFLGGIIF